MRLRVVARLSAAALAACTALTGVDKLSVDDDGAPIDLPVGGGTDAQPQPDGTTSQGDGNVTIEQDASTDATTDASMLCDEPGLIAWWHLDEGNGFDLHDCTSNKLDGKLDGGDWVQGKKSMALAFDAGWAGFGNSPLLGKTGAFTVMAWVRTEPRDSGLAQYIVGKNGTVSQDGWRLARLGQSYALAISGDGSVQTTAGTVVDNTWTHVTATYEPNTAVEIYVNGDRLIRNTNAKTPQLVATPIELRIGNKGDGQYPFYGAIDEVRIYDRVLTQAEVAARAAP